MTIFCPHSTVVVTMEGSSKFWIIGHFLWQHCSKIICCRLCCIVTGLGVLGGGEVTGGTERVSSVDLWSVSFRLHVDEMIWQATRAGHVWERVVVGLGHHTTGVTWHHATGVTWYFVETNVTRTGQGRSTGQWMTKYFLRLSWLESLSCARHCLWQLTGNRFKFAAIWWDLACHHRRWRSPPEWHVLWHVWWWTCHLPTTQEWRVNLTQW